MHWLKGELVQLQGPCTPAAAAKGLCWMVAGSKEAPWLPCSALPLDVVKPMSQAYSPAADV